MKMSKGFFVVLACFSLLILPVLQGNSLAACSSPAKIVGYSYAPASVQDAYNYASGTLALSDFTLQLTGEILTEDLLLDGGNVTFDGGYDCSFAAKTAPTILARSTMLHMRPTQKKFLHVGWAISGKTTVIVFSVNSC